MLQYIVLMPKCRHSDTEMCQVNIYNSIMVLQDCFGFDCSCSADEGLSPSSNFPKLSHGLD